MASGRGIDRLYERRLAALANARVPGLLAGGLRGLERESLRVTPDGALARTPHPRALGSALTHPHITTDFSESLLELVTPPLNSNRALLAWLERLLGFVHGRLDGELLWASSMPCEIAGEAAVPIADYGSSHQGLYKHVYRRGLRTRYGGMMQAIAGVHFNYSFPQQFWPLWAEVNQHQMVDQHFISECYFALLRNFRRHVWVIPWLCGATPAMQRSFLQGRDDALLTHPDAHTSIAAHATSLRMSDLGYRNRNQNAVTVSVNSLDDYLRDLVAAVRTPYPPFAALGVQVDGEFRQLSANRLQIENEYYSNIRPKRVPQAGENTCQALARRGVEYIEVRALDLDPFSPAGVTEQELNLIEALLLMMLARSSAPIDAAEQGALDLNLLAVARGGRERALTLTRDGRNIDARLWLGELLDQLQGCCELLDAANASQSYTSALARARELHADPARLPSARVLDEVREQGGFAAATLQRSKTAAAHYVKSGAEIAGEATAMQQTVEESLLEQEHMERATTGSFAGYVDEQLRKYLRIT